jgi:hypothetical protein
VGKLRQGVHTPPPHICNVIYDIAEMKGGVHLPLVFQFLTSKIKNKKKTPKNKKMYFVKSIPMNIGDD